MGKKVIGAILIVVGVVLMSYGNANGYDLVMQGGQMMALAGLAMVLAPRVFTPSNLRTLKHNPRTGIGPRQLVYGNTIVSGPIVYLETLPSSDSDVEDLLHRIIVLAGHPIESIDTIYLADEPINAEDITGEYINLPVEDNPEAGKKALILGVTQNETDAPDSAMAIAVRKAAGSAWSSGGTSSESPDNTIVSDTVAQGSTRKLEECPYVYVRLKLEEDGWKSIPTIRAVVKGKKLLSATEIRDEKITQPSLTDTEILQYMRARDVNNDLVNTNTDGEFYLRYGNNSVNCVLDYLLDEKLGLGVPLAEIDLDSFANAELSSAEVVHSESSNVALKDRGTDTDATIIANDTGIYGFLMESVELRNPNIRPVGQVRIHMPDGSVLHSTYIGTTSISPIGLPVDNSKQKLIFNVAESSSSSGNDANSYSVNSYIDFSNGVVYVETTATYDAGADADRKVYLEMDTSASGSTTRYTCDGAISLDATPIQIVEEMLTSCAGMLAYTQGKYKLFVGKWETPIQKFSTSEDIYITEEDLAGPIQVQTAVSRSERFNAIKGMYADASNKWEMTDFPEVSNAAYKTADIGDDDYINPERNGYIYRDVNLPFTTNADTATRLAKIYLDKGRQSLGLRLTCKASALQFSPGNNVYVKLPSLGVGDPTRPDFSAATLGAVTESSGVITNIAITDGGLGYLYPPDIELTGSPTTNASVMPIIEAGTIKEIKILDGGTGYTAPVATVKYDSLDINFWTDKIFKVQSWGIDESGQIELMLREDVEAIYLDGSPEFLIDPSPDLQDDVTSLGSRRDLNIPNMKLLNTATVKDGEFLAGINVTWEDIVDIKRLSYYEVEMGTGLLWRKKITSMDVEAARRDALPAAYVPTSAGTINFKWVPEATITEAPASGLLYGDIVIPAHIDITITAAGSGYKPVEAYAGADKYSFIHTITDPNNSETAELKFWIDPDTTGLQRVVILSKTGDFAKLTDTADTIDAPIDLKYRGKVNFTLADNVLDYPPYKEMVSRYGPYAAYVLDTTSLESATGGYPPLLPLGTTTLGDTFDTGFNNFPNCATLTSTATLETDIDASVLDFTSGDRDFSVEVVFSIPATSTTYDVWKIVDSAGLSLIELEINTTLNTVSLKNNSGTTISADYTFAVDTPYHIVCSERGLTAIGGYESKISVEGAVLASTSTEVAHGLTTSGIVLGGSSTMSLAMFNIYNKSLNDAMIAGIYSDLDNDSYTEKVLADVDNITIVDIEQSEFNGVKTELVHGFTMATDTTGSFDILDINKKSSFASAANGLPGANLATFGTYVYKENDSSVWYPVGSIERTVNPSTPTSFGSPATNVLTFKTPVTGTTAFSEGDNIFVFGAYDENREERFSGMKTISVVTTNGGNIESVTWDSKTLASIKTDSSAVLDKDEAYLYLDYPDTFTYGRKVGKESKNTIDIFDGVVNGKEHVVRVRAIDKKGRAGDWLYASIFGESDLTQPNPIYFTGLDGDRQLTFNFDFTADLTGAADADFHTETNLSYIELVVVRGTVNRYDALSNDPGARAYEQRMVVSIPIASNAKSIADGVVEYVHTLTGHPYDYYAWARLVSKSGQKSRWFSDDAGTGDGTMGIGPLRADAGIHNNLLGNDNSEDTTTTITTTTNNNDGGAEPPGDITDPPIDLPDPFNELEIE